MRITYVANIRMPTERAHGAQIMHMCDAFVRAGANVELVVPNRKTHIESDPFAYYGIEKNFVITRIPVFDAVSWGTAGFIFESFSFAWNARRSLRSSDFVYGRDELVLSLLYFFDVRRIIWESHTGAWNFSARYLCRKLLALVVISQGLLDWYITKGVPEKKIMVAHDGVTVADFTKSEIGLEKKNDLDLPQDKKIALYIGGLDNGKGVDVFAQSAALLPEDIQAVIIGGSKKEIAVWKEKFPKILFPGSRPYRELPKYQSVADVLVVPNSNKFQVWSQFTSPLKLFSALASGVPVVASATPSILEVVGDSSAAYLVTPDDSAALAEGIQRAIDDKEGTVVKALELVKQYDWLVRAQNILHFISAKIS